MRTQIRSTQCLFSYIYNTRAIHVRSCSKQLAAIERRASEQLKSREEFNSATRRMNVYADVRKPDAPRGLTAFTFTCNYLLLRVCLSGNIIARGSNDSPLVPPSQRGQRREKWMVETWLVGEKFSNSTLLVVTGCFLVRSKRLHAIITLFPRSTSALGILFEEVQARDTHIDIHTNFRGY